MKTNTHPFIASFLLLCFIFFHTNLLAKKIDPIRFSITTDASYLSVNEEFEIKITAKYLSINPNLVYVLEGSNSFKLKLIVPDGFKQTGGTYSDFVGIELTSTRPSVTYTLKGKFTSETKGGIFQLLRSHKNADNQSDYIQVGTLSFTAQENAQTAGDSKSARTMLTTLNYIPSLSMAELRAYGTLDTLKTVFITDQRKQGLFVYTPSSTAADDSAMAIISSSRKYERVYEGNIKPEWFGAIPDDTGDDTPAFNKMKNKVKGVMHIPAGTYIINNLNLGAVGIIGADNAATILKSSGSTPVLLLGYDAPHWRMKILQSLTIDGNSKASHGVEFSSASSTETSGRWVMDRVTFKNCNYAVSKPTGNIGNVFRDCNFDANNFGYHALGSESPYMHAGFDSFYNCSFAHHAKACVYINSTTPGTGGTRFESSHFEENPGFGLFVKNYKPGWAPLQFNEIWTERNATAAVVDIDDISYTPSAIYLENTDNFTFTNSGLADGIVIKNSKGSFRSSHILGNKQQTVDLLSVVYGDELLLDSYKGGIIVNSLRANVRPLGNLGVVLRAPARKLKTTNVNALTKQSYSDSIVTMGGSGSVTGVKMNGGLSFPSFNRFTIPPGQTQVSNIVNITTDKFYVLTLSIRQISDEKPIIHFAYGTTASNSLQQQLVKNKWVTLATVGKADTSNSIGLFLDAATNSSNSILDLQGLQFVEFNSEEEAISYYNEGYMAVN